MTDDQLNLYLKQGMEKSMKALDLADKYADAVAAYRLESLYGISESCALEKLEAREKAFEALAAELSRLAAELEDAKQAAKTWENEAERRLDFPVIPPPPSARRRDVRAWMIHNAEYYGTVTELAEAANAIFRLPDGGLDDETHWVWDEAAEAIQL